MHLNGGWSFLRSSCHACRHSFTRLGSKVHFMNEYCLDGRQPTDPREEKNHFYHVLFINGLKDFVKAITHRMKGKRRKRSILLYNTQSNNVCSKNAQTKVRIGFSTGTDAHTHTHSHTHGLSAELLCDAFSFIFFSFSFCLFFTYYILCGWHYVYRYTYFLCMHYAYSVLKR